MEQQKTHESGKFQETCGDTQAAGREITESLLASYRWYLTMSEKRENTIEKYLRDVRKLQTYADGKPLTRELMLAYRDWLRDEKKYQPRSVNSYIVAANTFFAYAQWHELRTGTLKLQNALFIEEEKELTKAEYRKLVRVARERGNDRLSLIIMAICSTGARVSEILQFDVESIQKGYAEVNNKGKIRKVLLPRSLRGKLLEYAEKQGIRQGILFCTKSGKTMNRSNIWRDMKKLCACAGVEPEKVYPHNLRHLFARSYYARKKDIAKLAVILGHSSIETTRIYLRCTCEECLRDLEALDLVI